MGPKGKRAPRVLFDSIETGILPIAPPVNLSVSGLGSVAYCASTPNLPRPVLSWEHDGTYTAYQITFGTGGSLSNVYDSGEVSSRDSFHILPAGVIQYNKTYQWRARVKNRGVWSPWTEGPSFTTAPHSYPQVSFTFVPIEPQALQFVFFTDTSTAAGGYSIAGRSWIFQNAQPANASGQTVQTRFHATGKGTASLTVTDSSGFSCSDSHTFDIQKSIIKQFKEVVPR